MKGMKDYFKCNSKLMMMKLCINIVERNEENKNNNCPTLMANMGAGGHNVPIIL